MIGSSALLNPAFGGSAAGALHAISGPDHLAGLLAPCANKGFAGGAAIGAVWGAGHATSTVILGMIFYYLKNQMTASSEFLQKLSSYSSFFVGFNLILIGLVGIYETWGSVGNVHSTDRSNEIKATAPLGLIFGNGLLHGLSIDGAVSLIPSLALDSWYYALTFLLAYAMSAAAVISAATGVISAGISKLDGFVDSNVPQQLSLYSSILSLLVGTIWSLVALVTLKKEIGF